MPLNLEKGQNIKLDKALTKLRLGLGWNARSTDGAAFDLDAWAFLVKKDGKCRSEADAIYYRNLKAADGSVEHTGDNKTGAGDGDDESIKVDLSKVHADIEKIVFTVSIHKGKELGLNFGMVTGGYIRLINEDGEKEELKFDLTEDGGVVTSLIFAELYRHDGGWKFKAVGQGYKDGLEALIASYGL